MWKETGWLVTCKHHIYIVLILSFKDSPDWLRVTERNWFTILKHRLAYKPVHKVRRDILPPENWPKATARNKLRAVCAHFLHGHKFFIRLGGMACLNVLQALQFSFLSWHFVYFQHHWKISQRCSLQLQGHKHSWWLLLTFCNTPQLWILSSTSFRIPGCKTWVWTADQVFSVPFSVAKSPQQWRTRPGGPSKVSIPTTNNTVNENSGIFKIKLFLISKVHYWCISTENTYAVLDMYTCRVLPMYIHMYRQYLHLVVGCCFFFAQYWQFGSIYSVGYCNYFRYFINIEERFIFEVQHYVVWK